MKGSLLLVTLLACYCASQVLSASANDWKGKTIYQLLTDRFARTDKSTKECKDLWNYCGGSFQGIIDNLDYIAGMGFDAIWISPIPMNYPGGYHGYAATNWNAVNPHFGTDQDLKNLV